jgi:hypothetical protein
VEKFRSVAITEMTKWCATNAVRTQELFDAAAAESSPLFPAPRMRIGHFEVTVDLDTRIERRCSFEIRVSPINAGFRIARRYTSEAHTRLTVTVEQIAAPAAHGLIVSESQDFPSGG